MRVSVRDARGFSLVELMVVVAIIGILAAIAVPNFQRFTAKSKQAEAKASLSALYSSARAFSSEWGSFTNSFAAIGYKPSGWQRYEHGWTALYNPNPSGYAGPAIAAPMGAIGYCGAGAIGANGCGVMNSPIAPGALAGTAMNQTTFTAEARAHIGNANAATIDRWTITENKVITNVADGLP